MKLSDLMGFGIEVVIFENDGTVKHLETLEEVEQEIEDRAKRESERRKEREADNE